MTDENRLALILAPKKCKRIKRNGRPCGNYARKGQTVCNYHGGSAPQNVAAANRRLGESALILVETLLEVIEELKRIGDHDLLLKSLHLALGKIPGFGTNATTGTTAATLPAENREWLAFATTDEIRAMHDALMSSRELCDAVRDLAKVRMRGGEPRADQPAHHPSDVVEGYVLLPEGEGDEGLMNP